MRPLKAMHGGTVTLKYLADFPEVVASLEDPNYAGFIEQVVLARSRLMFGTYLSTFSAYAMRMRGWYYARDGEGRRMGREYATGWDNEVISEEPEAVPGGGIDAYYIADAYRDAMGEPGFDTSGWVDFVRENRYGYEGVEDEQLASMSSPMPGAVRALLHAG